MTWRVNWIASVKDPLTRDNRLRFSVSLAGPARNSQSHSSLVAESVDTRVSCNSRDSCMRSWSRKLSSR